MKKILGLDLGTNSIGWALVYEAENENEISNIIKLGVRVNPLSVEEKQNFEKGKTITTNAERTLKRSARRNLQRYKLRRENLIQILKANNWISDSTLLSENGNSTTFETYFLRAKAVKEKISLEEFARVLLMINKKRGYKSSRKVKNTDEGSLIDGMEIALKMYNENLTPGQLSLEIYEQGKRALPDYYRSDLQAEFDAIWKKQYEYYPQELTNQLKEESTSKNKSQTWAILNKSFNLVGIKRETKGFDLKIENYNWRVKGLSEKLNLEQLAIVLSEINNEINKSSGYLGAISDRSKELYFNKKTVGQFLTERLKENPNYSLKNQVFYRQDYLDEFNTLWESQAKYHPELTNELKSEIRDVVIFYQRKLKSQKGLISFCELEQKEIEVEIAGTKKKKTIGSRVIPKSSHLFQEFKIWQILNNLELTEKDNPNTKRPLEQEEKEILFHELNFKNKLSKTEALKLLFKNPKNLDLNFKDLEGNQTNTAIINACQTIIENSGHGEYDFSKMTTDEIFEIVNPIFEGLNFSTAILNNSSDIEKNDFEKQDCFKFWHLLYSFEGDDSKTGNEKLIAQIQDKYGFDKEAATILSNISFQPDYGSLSAKAIKNISPHLREGNKYDVACVLAGYNHSKKSLTKEQIDKKILVDKLEILPKNSLRNPVVEKILNQMINVVNANIEAYGKPDEIRIELARELKKSAQERSDLTSAINKSTIEHDKIRNILKTEFGLTNVSRNDIIRYKLYKELEPNGYKTLYSNTYIAPNKLFSKEFDIEHIIPQSRLFDDSFSNKTLEARSVNIEKSNETAYDYLANKGERLLNDFINTVEDLFKAKIISKTKYKKLLMKGIDIPSDFIERDLRDTQYIAKKAKSLLEDLVPRVVSTSGMVTDRLRDDWQLVNVMQELNWDKYDKLGLTEVFTNKDGHQVRRIKDWTKRNDHRHHAMDALTIAFTKPSHIQYLNNLNARSDKSGSIYGIETKELYRDEKGKLKFKPPFTPIENFRAAAKQHLENTLVSIKAKNKVATININKTKKAKGENKTQQLTPRGQLHLESINGSSKKYITNLEKVGGNFTIEKISKVANKKQREALLNRLTEFGNDPKLAFTGKNSLDKNPIYLDKEKLYKVPEKVKTVEMETFYTIRKEITPELKIDKVVDAKIKRLLEKRLKEFGDAKKAFSNLEENPIWLNESKGISIKRVTITTLANAEALHSKKDKDGKLILDQNGLPQPVDFVNTGNNHHVAIYKDVKGNLQENVITFYEATQRVNQGLPIVDKTYKKEEGWEFLFTMKQNEYFVFPNEGTGFNPNEIDLLNSENYAQISPNLFRVQKISTKNYFFRHHLETSVEEKIELKNIAFKPQLGLSRIKNIIKLRINHIGQIVGVGEYN